ncbi:MAG: hypothetical protein ACR2QM_05270 [Longimicrobiales bacterium]
MNRRSTTTVRSGALGTLGLIAFSACASGGPGARGGPTTGGSLCPDEPAPRTLLTVDCQGEIVPGLATWEVEDTVIALQVEPVESADGPDPAFARRLVESWPPVTAPPWAGHDVRRIIAYPDNEVQIEFGGESVPVRLFADPRLAPLEFRLTEARLSEDARDRIDSGRSPVLTRHERSVGYGRALGRDVARESFDRRYMVVATEGLAGDLSQAMQGAVVDWWVRNGVEGARRPAAPEQGHVHCSQGEQTGPSRSAGSTAVQAGPTQLAFPAMDPVAKEIADRLVSAALPGGVLNAWFPGGLTARPYDGPDAGFADARGTLLVLSVQVGPVHDCSIRGEILSSVPALDERVALTPHVVPIGETALFRIGPEEPGR